MSTWWASATPISHAEPAFLMEASGEAPEGRTNYRDHIVRLGDTSPEGLREKARFVLDEMERKTPPGLSIQGPS